MIAISASVEAVKYAVTSKAAHRQPVRILLNFTENAAKLVSIH